MKTYRAIIVGGASAGIVTTGYLAAPELQELELAAPAGQEPATTNQRLVDGATVETQRGAVQVQLVLEGDEIVWVNPLKLGSKNAYTIEITSDAFPKLRERLLEAQDWDVEYVSGASFYSPGFVESARSAMRNAGLAEGDDEPVVQPGEANDGKADYSRPGPEQPVVAQPTPSPEPSESEPPAVVADTFVGPRVTNSKGGYQAQLVVEDGEITDVQFLEAGTAAAESQRVNGFALPEIRERVLEAQTYDVDHVSGASFTSPAMLESIEGAFAEAGLA